MSDSPFGGPMSFQPPAGNAATPQTPITTPDKVNNLFAQELGEKVAAPSTVAQDFTPTALSAAMPAADNIASPLQQTSAFATQDSRPGADFAAQSVQRSTMNPGGVQPAPIFTGAMGGSFVPQDPEALARQKAEQAVDNPVEAPNPEEAMGGRLSNRIGLGQGTSRGIDLSKALEILVKSDGSDLHLTVGAPPTLRVDGKLTPIEGAPVLDKDMIKTTLYGIISQKQRETFEENLELDFAHAVQDLARFRVNMYQQRESIGAAFRMIPYEIKSLESLGVPPVAADFARLPRGLVLVTGPTGSGKSTTLASIIDMVNRTRRCHIMTVEDPIEFLHEHKMALVNQREVGQDTHSFANALKHVLRQDPDVILIGELRDKETISIALTAAETGHLVFGTLHTQDTAQTIDRIIDVFPPDQQEQVRTQLSMTIKGVMCQSLLKRADRKGRVVAVEVMVATPAICNLIREGKTHQVYSALQAGAETGMQTLDQHLASLVKQGQITFEVGADACSSYAEYSRLAGRAGR